MTKQITPMEALNAATRMQYAMRRLTGTIERLPDAVRAAYWEQYAPELREDIIKSMIARREMQVGINPLGRWS